MRDNGASVLEQYDFEVRATRRVRGALLADTDRGLMLLREASALEGGVPALCCLQRILLEQGIAPIDRLQQNRAGKWISENEYREKYIVKSWPSGRECDVRSEAELARAAGNLAVLHRAMVWKEPKEMEAAKGEGSEKDAAKDEGSEKDAAGTEASVTLRRPQRLDQTYRRHNQELKRIRRFIRKKPDKGTFETVYLQEFERMYAAAEYAAGRLARPSCRQLFETESARGALCHGDYNYHNVLICGSGTATVNFEHFYRGVQMDDLYYFLRKILEKYNWKQRVCDGILNAYAKGSALDRGEMDYLATRLCYPEKFWKTANAYYCRNKAWVPERSAQKLGMCAAQQERKKRLLRDVFGV